jgi:single-stranded DNA-specific DHH superfamily exonuclease
MAPLDHLQGQGLLIHHWDTDGLCSAALLLDHLADHTIDTMTPYIGHYYLTEEEMQHYSSYDYIIIVDMSLPESQIFRLAENIHEVLIFDHHVGRHLENIFHHNPIILGEDPEKYPATSWIVNEFLNNPINLLSLLGVVGDHEHTIVQNSAFYSTILTFCQDNHCTFEEMQRAVNLLDSNYKINDKKAVEQVPHLLRKCHSLKEILSQTQWQDNLQHLEKEIDRQLSIPFEDKEGVIVTTLDTPLNIISTIARRLAWQHQKPVVVINTGFFKDQDQVYVRSLTDLEPLIQRGRSLGFHCGGKKEVVGAVLPKQITPVFIKEIMTFLMPPMAKTGGYYERTKSN